MTPKEIDKLVFKGTFPEQTNARKLIHTHISWVILCDLFAYKIKKPINYSFLDFSTLELRKYFCERELELNQRFSKDIYIEVLPIHELQGHFIIGGIKGTLIDYTLKMRKLDSGKQMDVLISKNKVSETDIKKLAERIVDFHKTATIIREKNILDIKEKFNDLGLEKQFLTKNLGSEYSKRIDDAIATSNTFLQKSKKLLQERLQEGFYFFVETCLKSLSHRRY